MNGTNRQAFSFFSLVSVGLLVTLLGCGGGGAPTGKVSGKVTADGKPVTSGSLTFAPADGTVGKPAIAAVKADGSYTLSTYASGDGAVVGRHKVLYSPGSSESGQQEVQIPEPGKHDEAKPAEVPFSGLVPKEAEVEVKAGTNEINIELVPQPATPVHAEQ
ncbi:MAG: hypothetical protein GX575_25115 [Candidatus Anammoximicrobium sp.]|nr:hypothetical protein [Candidatus Anammoximicrobium sp.]